MGQLSSATHSNPPPLTKVPFFFNSTCVRPEAFTWLTLGLLPVVAVRGVNKREAPEGHSKQTPRPPPLSRFDTRSSSRFRLSSAPFHKSLSDGSSHLCLTLERRDGRGVLELHLFGPNKPSAIPCQRSLEVSPVASQSSEIVSSFRASSSFSPPRCTCTFFQCSDGSSVAVFNSIQFNKRHFSVRNFVYG